MFTYFTYGLGFAGPPFLMEDVHFSRYVGSIDLYMGGFDEYGLARYC